MAVMPSVEVGLDQEITMPDESFVLKYFEFLKVYTLVRKDRPISSFLYNRLLSDLPLRRAAILRRPQLDQPQV